jgi:hypothetical protein
MDTPEASVGQRAYEPLDSGLDRISADTDPSDTMRRVMGFSSKMGWLTVASTRRSLATAWAPPCFMIPKELAGSPIPESQLDFIHTATKRLFAVYREAFGS